MPNISVIVPIYNTEKHLDRCIESILNQTYKDFELILIDDGSTDNSSNICNKYKEIDTRIMVIRQNNRGVSYSRNIGISKAKGKYIAFVDGDDYVDNNFLHELLNTAINNNVDMSMCNYYLVKDDKKEKCSHGNKNNEVISKEYILNNIFNNSNTVCYFSLWNKLFKKNIIIKNRILLNEDMSFGEDLVFVTKYINCCDKIGFSSKCLYYYNQQEGGLFNKYRKSLINDFGVCYESIVNICKPNTYTDRDLIPLSIKYHMYIDRYIKGVVKNEKDKLNVLNDTFENNFVKKVYSIISMLNYNDLNKYNLSKYELRIPRLVTNNHIELASLYALYQNDENCFLRKIRRLCLNNLKPQ